MVAVFARLKLSLIARGSYSQQRRMMLLAGMAVLIIVGGGLGFFVFAATRMFELRFAANSARAAVTSLFLAWIISPFLLAGYDETIRPPHLALLPLRRRSLLAGMAAAAWIGAPPLSSAIVLLGTVPALGRSAFGVLAGLVGWLLAAALCLYTSRVVATAVSSLMSTRLARDLAIVAVMAILGASVLLSSLLTEAIARNARLLTTIGGILRWFPPGAAISAGADASTGDYARLAFDIFVPLAMLILVLAGWERALQRSMLRSSLSTSVRSERAQRHPRWSPRSRTQAAAWRMWRYLWRSSRYRAAIPLGTITGLFVGLSTQISTGSVKLPAVYVGVFIALWNGMMGMNMLGMEGKATWITVAVSGRTRADWIGRLGAFYSAAVLPAVIASVIAAGLTHTWYRLPAGLALAVTVLGAALACDALESVILPYATPSDDDSAFSRTRGNWLLGLLGMGGCMVGTLATTLPVAAVLTLVGPDRPWPDLAIGVGAIVYTVAIMASGAMIAGAIQDRRGPEILAVVGR